MDAGDTCRKPVWWCPGVMATYVSSVVCSCASEDDATDDADRTEQVQEKASVEEISLPLLTKMSSERTLAVQAALMQQPDKSLALLHGRSA
ncbi:ParB-like nuclease [Escherichia coli]|nr:ParB-like nuclease [Escherichia coli]